MIFFYFSIHETLIVTHILFKTKASSTGDHFYRELLHVYGKCSITLFVQIFVPTFERDPPPSHTTHLTSSTKLINIYTAFYNPQEVKRREKGG